MIGLENRLNPGLGVAVNRKGSLLVYGALVSAMLIWGFSFLAIKDAVASIPIFPLLFSRFSIATIILLPIAGMRRALRLPGRDLAVLAGLAALSPVGYFIFETYGVSWTQPSHVSLIIATIPIAVYLMAFATRKERPTLKRGIGVLIAYAGIILVIGLSRGEKGASLAGDVLVLGAVLCAAVRTILVKDVLRRVTPLQLTFYQFFFSLFVFGPLAAADGFCWLEGLTLKVTGEILFLGVLCSAGAFFAMHYALTHLAATQVAVAANLVPIVTLIAEATILGIGVTMVKSLGTLLTIGGVIVAQLGSTSEPIPVSSG